MSPLDLATFVRRVCDRALQRADEATLHADQRRLLRETLIRFNGHCDPSDPAQPLGLFHLVAQVHGPVEPRLLVHLASFCWLYTCSLDLFDDMQDDDLAGKPHEKAGPAIAVNSALALLFLALDELRLATRLESRIEPRRGYAELFNRISLLTVGAQHADLLGGSAAGSPADVLEMNRGKTASVALFLECASLAAGASLDEASAYGRVGLDLAGLVQIVDDVRDIYGKDHSPDLLTGKYTYPLACFRESASPTQLAQLEVLLAQRPLPLVEIRELIHEAAAMDRCAEEVEAIRERIHGRLAELSGAPPQHRVLLDIVDALASTLYEPEPLPVTARLWNPDGAFSRVVRSAVGEFAQLVGLDVESLPRLLPWHQPYFVFDPERQAIFYPDVDGLPHEVAAFHVQFVGGNVTSACQALSALAPATVAHELVHALREHAGLLTDDHWHEEYVANRLAVGFLRGTDATRWEICRRLVRGACERGSRHLDETAHAILLRSAEPALAGGSPGLGSLTDYGVSLETSAAIHWQMVDQLMDAEPSFEEDLAEYVGLRRQDELAAE